MTEQVKACGIRAKELGKSKESIRLCSVFVAAEGWAIQSRCKCSGKRSRCKTRIRLERNKKCTLLNTWRASTGNRRNNIIYRRNGRLVETKVKR
jgi:hypothetical protein